jgi:hypothetical protein
MTLPGSVREAGGTMQPEDSWLFRKVERAE